MSNVAKRAEVPLPEMTAEERKAFIEEKQSEARTKRVQGVLTGTGAGMALTAAGMVAAGKTRKRPRLTESGYVLGSAAGGLGSVSGLNFARNEFRGARKAERDRERAQAEGRVGKASGDPEPGRRAKVRGTVPAGEEWREHVRPGARHAYDVPLRTAGEEARALARKGRLVAAHKREKARYKIRVRGYDRKYRPGQYEEVGKAVKTTTTKVGPYAKRVTEIRVRRPTKAERRNEVIRAVGSSVGGAKVVAGAGAGVAASEWWDDTKKKAVKAAGAPKQAIHDATRDRPEKKKEAAVGKSLTIDDILAGRLAKADEVALADLQEIHKGFLGSLRNSLSGTQIGALGQRYYNAAQSARAHGGGLSDSLDAMQKVGQRTGGLKGVGDAAWQDAGAALSNPQANKKAALGVGGAAAVGAAGYGAYKGGQMLKNRIKAKAKKAGMIGAGVLGGGAAAGGYLGSQLGN